jgi:AraC-like DNA-binding protein
MAGLTLDWMQLASLLGAVQGVFLAGTLIAQRQNRTANRLLAALVIGFTVYLASEVYYGTPAFRAFPHFFGISYQMPWIFGPLAYLYAVAAGDRSWRLRARDMAHFIPVAISVGVALPYYLMSGDAKVALFDRMMAGDVPRRIVLIDPFKFVSGIGYSIATFAWLRRHRHRIEHSYSNLASVSLSWLLWLAGAAAGVWLIATLGRVTEFGRQLNDDVVALAIAAIVYAIGYRGLRQPEVFRYETAEHPVVHSPAVIASREPSPNVPAAAESPRYERSGLGEAEAIRLREALVALMEGAQPWKDSELTLADLSGHLETTPHKLSALLNTEVGQTFHDFVNGYRVREVQRRIRAGDARTRKMLALALDAGFASKSTFNQAFRKHTNQTPSEFREAAGV